MAGGFSLQDDGLVGAGAVMMPWGDRETPQDTVNDLWLIEYAGLPGDYFQRALAAYKQTTAPDVQRIASALIDPKALSIVVVGDAQQLQPELGKIAPVTVVTAK